MTPTRQNSTRYTHIFSALIVFMLITFLTACGGSEPTTDPESIQLGSVRLAPSEDGSALEIWVDDVADLAGIDVAVQFDPAKMQVADVDSEAEGIQIHTGEAPSPDFVADNSVDNENGVVRYAAIRIPPSTAYTGTGRVATIQWASGFDITSISFGEVKMANSKGEAIEP